MERSQADQTDRSLPARLKQRKSNSVWFHPVMSWSAAPESCFSLVSSVTTREDRDGEMGGKRLHIIGWDASLGHWTGEWRQGKVYKAAFIWVKQGHEGGAGFHRGFCVIVSLLIKVKGVSWIVSPRHMLLLDICCFQVEEMFKDWWVDLQPVPTTYYLKSARCNPTDVPTTNFSYFTQTTGLFSYMAARKLFPFWCMYGFLVFGCYRTWQQTVVLFSNLLKSLWKH